MVRKRQHYAGMVGERRHDAGMVNDPSPPCFLFFILVGFKTGWIELVTGYTD
jgi:hypothetical protein